MCGIRDFVPLPHSKSLLLRISRTNVLLDFSRLRRSLATSTLYAAVRIPAERFLCNGNEISHYTQKSCRPRRQPCFALYDFFVVRSGKIKYKLRLCLILFLTTKPPSCKRTGVISPKPPVTAYSLTIYMRPS